MADLPNPYVQLPSMESEEIVQHVILDESGPVMTGITSTKVVMDPMGGRHAFTQQGLARTNDGTTAIPGEPLYTCINGCRRPLLTSKVMLRCTRCHMPVCYSCLSIV